MDAIPLIENPKEKTNSLLDEEDDRIKAVYQFNSSPNKNIGKLWDFFSNES
jgi:hypothetical protein